MCLGKKCSQVRKGEQFKFRRNGYRAVVTSLGSGRKTVPVEAVEKHHGDPEWVKDCDWCFGAYPVELTPA